MTSHRFLSLAPLMFGLLLCGAVSFAQQLPVVLITTEIGAFRVALDTVHAPLTAANFLRYVDNGLYDGGSFFRTVTMDNQPNDSVRIEVIQGGIAAKYQDRTFTPITLERTSATGLRHRKGTISMARSGPNTATWSFFVCLRDEPELDFGGQRNPDGQGFAPFGAVIDGLEVVQSIHSSPARGQSLTPPLRIISITRIP